MADLQKELQKKAFSDLVKLLSGSSALSRQRSLPGGNKSPLITLAADNLHASTSSLFLDRRAPSAIRSYAESHHRIPDIRRTRRLVAWRRPVYQAKAGAPPRICRSGSFGLSGVGGVGYVTPPRFRNKIRNHLNTSDHCDPFVR